jgi:zinc D-Ala-D-Ala dipeptidase
MPEPEETGFDPNAPIVRIRPEELPAGLGLAVAPAYHTRGYEAAPSQIWLRVQLIHRLLQAALVVREEDYGLLLWDGWRPPELQKELWHEYREKLARSSGLVGEALDNLTATFVSDPSAPGMPAHTTGGAVDLTLCDASGQPVEMGGEFDELTDRSHPDYYERPSLSAGETIYRDRRRLLLHAMTSAGFWRLPTEWWHFEWGTPAWAAITGGQPSFGVVTRVTG